MLPTHIDIKGDQDSDVHNYHGGRKLHMGGQYTRFQCTEVEVHHLMGWGEKEVPMGHEGDPLDLNGQDIVGRVTLCVTKGTRENKPSVQFL